MNRPNLPSILASGATATGAAAFGLSVLGVREDLLAGPHAAGCWVWNPLFYGILIAHLPVAFGSSDVSKGDAWIALWLVFGILVATAFLEYAASLRRRDVPFAPRRRATGTCAFALAAVLAAVTTVDSCVFFS